MDEAIKKACVDTFSAQLEVWRTRLAVVKANVAKGTADVRVDYQMQIADWQRKERSFRTKIDELRSAGTEGYETKRAAAQTARNNLSIIVDKFGDKR